LFAEWDAFGFLFSVCDDAVWAVLNTPPGQQLRARPDFLVPADLQANAGPAARDAFKRATVFKWGTTEDTNQEPEPWNNSRRSSSDSSSHSSPHSYAHTRSAHRRPASPASPPWSFFRSGTTVIATASARDPSNPDLVAFVPILVGLDSYSDITVAAPELVYNNQKITESVSTGAGASDYFEEGFIDIADGLYSFRTLPVLAASSPHHLPSSCALFLGVPQLNELDIRVDVHRMQRKLPLSSYDPSIILAADSPLECRLSERDLDKWATHNSSKPVGSVPYSYLDVDINPALSADQQAKIQAINEKFQSVFDASQGALPTLADHPPVTLNFKPDWKHVSVPQPRWGPGATAVLTKWAEEMFASGLYVPSQSASASRPHIVKKTPSVASACVATTAAPTTNSSVCSHHT
jgi:hypothetical protein